MTDEEKQLKYIDYLVKENAELKAQNEELQFNLRSRNDLVEELTMQIEKMKCCGNCKHYVYDCGEKYCKYDATREKDCINKNQWELAE